MFNEIIENSIVEMIALIIILNISSHWEHISALYCNFEYSNWMISTKKAHFTLKLISNQLEAWIKMKQNCTEITIIKIQNNG